VRKLATFLVLGLFIAPVSAATSNEGAGNRKTLRTLSGASRGAAPLRAGATGGARVLADFDDNGKDDLVVGIPTEDDGAIADSGAIHIFYGAGPGLSTSTSQVITQDDIPATDGNEDPDGFGTSLASGDFDNDGFPDLAVGSPFETVTQGQEGAVVVLFGSPTGVSTSGAQLITQSDLDGTDGPETDDSFGFTLAAGKFDTGPRFDLAIGTPLEDEEVAPLSPVDAGAVVVVYGGASGLNTSKNNLLSQAGSQVEEVAEENDLFGSTLAAGNLGRNSQWDLAVGARGETVNGFMAGAVHVFYGINATLAGQVFNGVHPVEDQFWSQASPGVADSPEDSDIFGLGLAVSNVGRSNLADLLIGAPGEGAPPTAELTGMLHVLFGANNGVTSKGAKVFTQDTPGVPDSRQGFDLFGRSVAAGDFDGDGDNDVAVGSDGESFGSGATEALLAGQVTILGSNENGPTGAGSRVWSQRTTGIPDNAETGDQFGISLAVGNYGRTAPDDLAIGTRETLNDDAVDPVNRAGAVHVLFGTATGISANNNQFLTEDCAGCPGSAEDNDQFGVPLG
jgi:FG-GAP repeat